MTVSNIAGATQAAQDAERATAALAKVLRTQREQGEATVALIEQAAAPPPTGRIIDVRA